MAKIKRSLQAIYLNVTPTEETADYKLVGVNVESLTINYNAQTESEQDIVSDTASTEVVGYEPTADVSLNATKGDDVFEFINGLRRKRAIMSDADSDIILVDLYEKHDDTDGVYVAEKQKVSIQFDTYGGAGGEPLELNFTLNFKGDSQLGAFTVSTRDFEAD